jgi:NADH:ubiquinone oxidoreductase subunit E
MAYEAPEYHPAFEEYCARCEVDTKKDAALHGYLHQITARARWTMEVALEKLADVEGIPVSNTPKNRPG